MWWCSGESYYNVATPEACVRNEKNMIGQKSLDQFRAGLQTLDGSVLEGIDHIV